MRLFAGTPPGLNSGFAHLELKMRLQTPSRCPWKNRALFFGTYKEKTLQNRETAAPFKRIDRLKLEVLLVCAWHPVRLHRFLEAHAPRHLPELKHVESLAPSEQMRQRDMGEVRGGGGGQSACSLNASSLNQQWSTSCAVIGSRDFLSTHTTCVGRFSLLGVRSPSMQYFRDVRQTHFWGFTCLFVDPLWMLKAANSGGFDAGLDRWRAG